MEELAEKSSKLRVPLLVQFTVLFQDRGADVLLCSSLSRHICALGSLVTAASLVP